VLRYRWDVHEASALWSGEQVSPELSVRHGGVSVLDLSELPPRAWVTLDVEHASRLEKTLLSTSLLEVFGEGDEPGLLLVQEEGMSHRPSLLLELSAADILRYWALLTVEQRTAFIEARARIAGDDDPLLAKLAPITYETTLFDRFAGVFHSFDCLEKRIREALDEGKVREADYRLFGRKYDSLGSLLDRVLKDAGEGRGDAVEQYVVVLCAIQLLRELERAYRDYWAEHRNDVQELESRLAEVAALRTAITAGRPEMPEFLAWFEMWFLRRAEAVSEEEPS
jgi:hypothetical protein